ncbi:hypothetical protein DNK48_41475 [Streptomyces malaysiensis subsp. malaysiensis]|uniref:hypothetical protein n=1 Tax=Streptomyces malaysiensis TaxID=92644 RepID=UPI000BFE69DA|nr:hypothetical protein [Streptomyces malaysiensis]ATL80676.1 hypothetical protein SMALA_0433 [Streptomyces malaysiensis]QDL75955.1 hypothetical protein DNK48_41475 [Streptomyces malaysiensis]
MSDLVTDELIDLQKSADAEHQRVSGLDGEERRAQWERWRVTAERVQAAITEHATSAGLSRFEVERAVKKAVRHPEDSSAA